jgi:hypothetical protein
VSQTKVSILDFNFFILLGEEIFFGKRSEAMVVVKDLSNIILGIIY